MRLLLLVTTITSYASTIGAANPNWAGFASLRKLIVFGDSYSTYNFNLAGPQPSKSNPFGNGNRGRFNGPSWAELLTYTYNQSAFLTYDLAFRGSPVDTAIVSTIPTSSSLAWQLSNYTQRYGNAGFADASTTLYAAFLGPNDVCYTIVSDLVTAGNVPDAKAQDARLQAVITRYTKLLSDLYNKGARNFLIINIPPMQRSPSLSGQKNRGDDFYEYAKSTVKTFNYRLRKMAEYMQANSKDSRVFFYDLYTDLVGVLANPSVFPETAGFKDIKNYCPAYRTATMYEKSSECTYATQQYYWQDSLHVSWPAQKLMGRPVAELLQAKGT